MDYCQRRVGAISQLFSEPVSDTKLVGWPVHNHTVPRVEVICPKPCRPVRVSSLTDGIGRFSCKTKNFSAAHCDDDLDILDFIFSKDFQYDDPERSGEGGNFCRSPPLRSTNPLSQDPEFVKQSTYMASPTSGNSCFGMQYSRMERAIPSCGTSCSGSPKVRIEGFPSGSPECHSVVSARA